MSHLRAASLHVFPEGAVWVGDGNLDTPHRHFPISVVIGLSGPLAIRTLGRPFSRTRIAFTAPYTRYQLDARDVHVLLLLIDPESAAGQGILPRFLNGERLLVLDEAEAEALLAVAAEHLRSGAALADLWDDIVKRLSRPPAPQTILDLRIRRVASILKQDVVSPPSVGELARRVGISKGHLIHLFTHCMGLPIRQYVHWLRVREALVRIGLGMNLTEAAHAVGFADLPHFTRIFRSMFGDPPSASVMRGTIFDLDLNLDFGTARLRPGPHAETDAALWQLAERTLRGSSVRA